MPYPYHSPAIPSTFLMTVAKTTVPRHTHVPGGGTSLIYSPSATVDGTVYTGCDILRWKQPPPPTTTEVDSLYTTITVPDVGESQEAVKFKLDQYLLGEEQDQRCEDWYDLNDVEKQVGAYVLGYLAESLLETGKLDVNWDSVVLNPSPAVSSDGSIDVMRVLEGVLAGFEPRKWNDEELAKLHARGANKAKEGGEEGELTWNGCTKTKGMPITQNAGQDMITITPPAVVPLDIRSTSPQDGESTGEKQSRAATARGFTTIRKQSPAHKDQDGEADLRQGVECLVAGRCVDELKEGSLDAASRRELQELGISQRSRNGNMQLLDKQDYSPRPAAGTYRFLWRVAGRFWSGW
ncbi:hypothetical protein MKZ38_009202 [Zalerion maritima]|uniref:Uncharacterized protein n=1 Tax=Zalerion maritima TaxID=339359 RepID=A0AAD5RGP7_9PEZI|nr:hypothetical protein MKZ38_009202 [Zalerion maritima]